MKIMSFDLQTDKHNETERQTNNWTYNAKINFVDDSKFVQVSEVLQEPNCSSLQAKSVWIINFYLQTDNQTYKKTNRQTKL